MKNLLFFSIMLLVLISCEKEDEDPVPTISSKSFTVTEFDWTDEGSYYYTELNTSVSTDDVVQVYFSLDRDQYGSLPITLDDNFSLYSVLQENGKVGIEFAFYGNSGTPSDIGTLFFKVAKTHY